MVKELNKWCFAPLFSLLIFINGNPGGLAPETRVHPLHIATVEIEHNANEKTLEITCKTFWDDFEDILSKNNKSRVDLTNDKATTENNKKILEYIKTHLQVSVDGKNVLLGIVGFEKEDEVIYSYLQAEQIPSVKKISITNTLMYDLFDDQVGIIHVIVNGKRQSTKLEYPVKKAEFVY